jgi:hypothetical protein
LLHMPAGNRLLNWPTTLTSTRMVVNGTAIGPCFPGGAGFAGGFHAAVEFGGPGAPAVAEHAGVGFAAKAGHASGLVVGGQFGWEGTATSSCANPA